MTLGLVLLVMTLSSVAQVSKNSARAIMQKFAPDEYEILRRYESLPDRPQWKNKNGHTVSTYADNDVFEYLNTDNERVMLKTMALNVHELNHALTHTWVGEWVKTKNYLPGDGLVYYFYIRPGVEYLVDTELKFFPSKVLADRIPVAQRTYRFPTYITGNSSTQAHGLLGLLNEYNAYLHSMKTAMQLRPAYLALQENSIAENYCDWLNNVRSFAASYYEFRFFILEYLLYARQYESSLYEGLRNDPVIIRVFIAISEEFYPLIQTWQEEITNGYVRFAAQYKLEYKAIPGFELMFRNKSGYSGVRMNDEGYDQLFSVLHSGRYDQVMTELGIKPFREKCFGKE